LVFWGIKSKHFLVLFIITRKPENQIKENWNFYAKPVCGEIEFIFFGVTQK